MIETITFAGKEISLYYSFWLLSLVIALIAANALRKDYGFSFSRSVIYIVFQILIGYPLIWLLSWVFGGGKMIGFNFVRLVNFIPLYFILIATLFREKLWKLADFSAPIGALIPGVSHLGCIFSGCCHGFPSNIGIYSNVAKTICFPIQPIESITNIIIGIVLFVMAKRKIQQGRLYSWFMVLFGGTRFVFEFFRDNQKIIWGISDLAFHALASFLIGLIALILMKCFCKKEIINEKI